MSENIDITFPGIGPSGVERVKHRWRKSGNRFTPVNDRSPSKDTVDELDDMSDSNHDPDPEKAEGPSSRTQAMDSLSLSPATSARKPAEMATPARGEKSPRQWHFWLRNGRQLRVVSSRARQRGGTRRGHQTDGQPIASQSSHETNNHKGVISQELVLQANNLDPTLLAVSDLDELWYQFSRSRAPKAMHLHVSFQACQTSLFQLTTWYARRGAAATWEAVASTPPRPPSASLLAVAAALGTSVGFNWLHHVDRVDLAWYYLDKPPSDFWEGFNPADETHVNMSLQASKDVHWDRRRRNSPLPGWFSDEVARLLSAYQKHAGRNLQPPDTLNDIGMGQGATGNAGVPVSLNRSIPAHGHHEHLDTASTFKSKAQGLRADEDHLLKLHVEQAVQDFLEKRFPQEDASKDDTNTAPREKYGFAGQPRLHSPNPRAQAGLIDTQAKNRSLSEQIEEHGLQKAKAASKAARDVSAPRSEAEVTDLMQTVVDEKIERLHDLWSRERTIVNASIDQIESIEEELRAAGGAHMNHWHDFLASARHDAAERLKQLDSCGDFQLADKLQRMERERQVGNDQPSHPNSRGREIERPQTGGAVDVMQGIKRKRNQVSWDMDWDSSSDDQVDADEPESRATDLPRDATDIPTYDHSRSPKHHLSPTHTPGWIGWPRYDALHRVEEPSKHEVALKQATEREARLQRRRQRPPPED